MTPDQSRTAQLYQQNPRKAAPRLDFRRSILISPPLDGRQPHDRLAGKEKPDTRPGFSWSRLGGAGVS